MKKKKKVWAFFLANSKKSKREERMLPHNDEATAVQVPPAFAAMYQRTRLKANAVLLRYGHIIPVAAVLICLLISTTISIEREVQYQREAKKANTSTTKAPATTDTVTETPAPESKAANSDASAE